jgi:uncharacterized protein
MATERPHLICRRAFLAGAGAGLGALLLPSAARALANADAVYVSAYKAQDGSYGAAVLTADGKLVHQAVLPGRGHGFAVHRESGRLVGFARRPGSFAVAFEDGRLAAPLAFSTPQGRHFFGHGLFSPDGRLLYTTENDFENAAGVIGVHDAANGYKRIGEFPSFGIDPHDMVLMADGHTLCIANGGIVTHPDFGRAKLNLAAMQPSISFVDARHGTLVARHEPPSQLSRLSLRHLAADNRSRVWFGAQWEGDEDGEPPLIGHVTPDGGIVFMDVPPETLAGMKNYVGSVAALPSGAAVAFTSPAGGRMLVVDAQSGAVAARDIDKVCGVAGSPGGFVTSSENGRFQSAMLPMAWDNHIVPLPGA